MPRADVPYDLHGQWLQVEIKSFSRYLSQHYTGDLHVSHANPSIQDGGWYVKSFEQIGPSLVESHLIPEGHGDTPVLG